ncbi:RecB family exonuclease [Streptosporangium canum]|uniref:RecB family exonuclease n=1 Tax=Streptosporangium canum TaxID=324952 RepID=UPI003689CA45
MDRSPWGGRPSLVRSILRRSASQLTSYSSCGERYKQERVERVDQLPAAWTMQGTAFHKAIEAYERSCRSLSLNQTQEVFAATWHEEVSKGRETQPDLSKWLRGGRKSTDKDIAERYAAGLAQVAGYIEYTQYDPLKPLKLPDGSPAVEVGFLTVIGGVDVLGYIDLVLEDDEGNPFVRDLKTGAKAPFLPLQLVIYRRGLRDTLGLEAAWGDFYMARENGPTDPISLHSLSDELLDQWFSDMDRSESAGLYLPNPSADTCWSCSVKHHCRVFQSN